MQIKVMVQLSIQKNLEFNKKERKIRYSEEKILVEDFNYLNEKVGWGRRENIVVKEALDNTLYSITVYDDEKVIGYGRIIGDKTIFLYIQDIIVLPEYQGNKIGTEIMNLLLKKINEYKKINPAIRTYIGPSLGRESFYKKFGFKTRKVAGLGEGMVLF